MCSSVKIGERKPGENEDEGGAERQRKKRTVDEREREEGGGGGGGTVRQAHEEGEGMWYDFQMCMQVS